MVHTGPLTSNFELDLGFFFNQIPTIIILFKYTKMFNVVLELLWATVKNEDSPPLSRHKVLIIRIIFSFKVVIITMKHSFNLIVYLL